MNNRISAASIAAAIGVCVAYAGPAQAEEKAHQSVADDDGALCLTFGPQSPRDISKVDGINPVVFGLAPPRTEMELCNIHTHTNAEHKGPGYSVFVSDGEHGGYACTETGSRSAAALEPLEGEFHGVAPGDTIEVHWVHTTCTAEPGPGLGSCVPEGCENPVLRVEAQTFLVVNDRDALDFMDMVSVKHGGGYFQPGVIPSNTGTPVVYLGSTTGPSYNQSQCSPAKVTWSVRPQCAKVDIATVHEWAEMGNVFEEDHSHGVRQLVTAPELLSSID